jgi:hypothetical protein
VRHAAGTTEPERYATALAGVWGSLGATLARLESIAAAPDGRLDEGAAEALPVLQYGLHRAGELCLGIEPPAGAECAHAELGAALEEARNATGEVCAVLEDEGPEAAAMLVHEWRGALFRVRLARRRLAFSPVDASTAPEPRAGASRAAAGSTLLVVGGTAAFTAGAVLALWPLWAVGLALVAAGFLAYRP